MNCLDVGFAGEKIVYDSPVKAAPEISKCIHIDVQAKTLFGEAYWTLFVNSSTFVEYYEECANSLNTFKTTDTEPREQKKMKSKTAQL